VDDTEITKVEQVPPHETSAAPVELSLAVPRYFGITPPTLLFGIATATLAISIVLAIFEHWLAALVLAVAVLVEIALFFSIARRKPDTVVARASIRAMRRARERAAWLVEATSVRTEAGRRLKSLRLELLELGERRDRALRDLGAAFSGLDDEAVRRQTEALRRIEEDTQEKEGQMRAIAESAQERLQEGRLRVEPTVIQRSGDEE
jgi:type IV secretory pathway VirB3-like protein